GMPRAVYYGVEAKVLTTRTVGARRPGASVQAYVEEGVRRFVDGDQNYSSGLPMASMVGFVLSGPVSKLVVDIQAAVSSAGLGCTQPLVVQQGIVEHVEHYQSIHNRVSGSIELDHLFLSVDGHVDPEKSDAISQAA